MLVGLALVLRGETSLAQSSADSVVIRVALERWRFSKNPYEPLVKENILALGPIYRPVRPPCDSSPFPRPRPALPTPCGPVVYGFPEELITAAAELAVRKEQWSKEELPNGIRLLPDSLVTSAFHPKIGTDLGWGAFYQRYPNSGGIWKFSRALITSDGTHALALVVHACGALCGETAYVWLRRDSPDGAWYLYRWIRLAVS